ncbi:tetratricopeptide repeat protein [Sulfurospirillum sp. 1307]|jgi:tetratricopeptide (TPR) repeat protein
MKKIFIYILIITSQLYSLNVSLNSALEEGTSYSLLHVEDNEPIFCEEIPKELGKSVYLCKFDKIVKTPLKPKVMKLVDIDFLEKEKEFFIRISPKVESKLIAVKEKLYEEKEIGIKNEKPKYKHWMVLLYEKSPFVQKKVNDGINFPIMFPKNEKPYVGALDLNGAPISYVQSKDIRLYIDLKKAYENNKYDNVIDDSLEITEKYPNSIFKSELLLYRLRAIDKGLEENNPRVANKYDYNTITQEGKAWIKAFPSDNNIPEVLMLISKAYLNMGFKADANYFLDILVSEHKDSSFTKKAILIFADSLYNSRQQDKAIKLYKEVLYSARDLDVAASAAIRLSEKELDRKKKQSAREYLIKVLDANEEYLLKDRTASYELAKKLAQNSLYDVAAKVADVLLKGLKKHDENAEALLKDSGIWHAKANDIDTAYNQLQKYLKEYKNGDFIDVVQSALDELFFELNETNETKLAKYYDTLIQKYKNKIGDRAVVEKAKLLLSQKRYKDVLKMEKSLKYALDDKNSTKTPKLVQDAVYFLVRDNLKNDECIDAVGYIERYKIGYKDLDNNKLFDCFIRTSRYKKAQDLSLSFLKEQDLKKRLVWLENYALSQFKLSNYEKVVEIGRDVQKLATTLKMKPKRDTYMYMFLSFMKLNKFDNAIKIANEVDKNFKDSLKNADMFMEIVKRASDDRNDLLLETYAKKVLALQNKYKSYVYTPMVEFALIGSLERLLKLDEAYKIASQLVKKELDQKDLVRAFYIAGELALKIKNNEDAKKFFQECIDIKIQSSWKDICEQNLKLL